MFTVFAREALLPSGWAENVEIRITSEGRIEGVKPGRGSGHDLMLPAPANIHSHSFQRAVAGLTERSSGRSSDSFWSWRHQMYRFLDLLGPDEIEAIAAQAFMEMLESGYGSVAEFHYLHNLSDGTPYEDRAEISARIVKAAHAAGIGLTLLPALYMYGGCDRRPPAGAQRRFFNTPDSFAALHGAAAGCIRSSHPDCALGTAAHSLRAVDPSGLTACLAMAQGAPFHIHAAEQTAEVAEIQEHLGSRPIEWLLGAMHVNDRWCVIHATQMTETETRRLARTGAIVGLCPLTEANLGDGIFNGGAYSDSGGGLAIGTDANAEISLFGELRMLEYSQRLARRARCALSCPGGSTGRFLFDCAAAGGGRAAGRPCGAIEEGRVADLIAISTDNDRICGRRGDEALDSLIFAGGGRQSVTDVWSAGRHVVRSGRHISRERISKRFRRIMRRLSRRL